MESKAATFARLGARTGQGMEVACWDEAQATYERLCASNRGLLTAIPNPRMWINIEFIFLFGVIDVMWCKLWQAEEQAWIMVNAALMSHRTSKLDKEPQVILV